MTKPILDAACGGRMFWFDKNNPLAVFMDNREFDDILCDGRTFTIKPDVLADFREIPFPDKTFKLVVFDPPHLIKAGKNSWLAKKYGVLQDTWKADIKQGFSECMRVLDDYGVLVFKWSADQIPTCDILKAIGHKPLFGSRRGKTRWLVFMKMEGEAPQCRERRPVVQKIYIAGKITGEENYRQKFKAAQDELEARGQRVMNPAILPPGFDYEDYMRICFAMIDVCDAVYFLADWRDSPGATREHEYASRLGKVIEHEEVSR